VRNVAVSIVCAMLMAEKMAATAEVVVEMATAEVVEMAMATVVVAMHVRASLGSQRSTRSQLVCARDATAERGDGQS